jgi:hypothetical protein
VVNAAAPDCHGPPAGCSRGVHDAETSIAARLAGIARITLLNSTPSPLGQVEHNRGQPSSH